MKIKNSMRNIGASVVNKVILTIFPIIIRTIIVYKLGEEYAGLTNLFTSILGMLSISELGFGTAATFCMYEPMAKHNVKKVNGILKFYKKIYQAIGIIILVLGAATSPFLKFLIKESYPTDINLYFVYFVCLVNLSLGYILWGYKKSLLIAGQRNDVDFNISSIVNIIGSCVQISVLFLYKDYTYYILVMPCITLLNNYIVSKSTDRMFPEYSANGEIEASEKNTIINKVKALLFIRIGNIILNYADNLVISSFLGLSVLAIYNNYYSIVYALISVTFMAGGSITSIVAREVIEKNEDNNEKLLRTINHIVCVISIVCSACLLNLLQPFMILWMGKERTLSFPTIILFCLYFYVWQTRRGVSIYKDALGLWEVDKWRPFVSGIFNLIINIILIQFIGVNGIIISTIASMLIVDIPWETGTLYKAYFKISCKKYFGEHAILLLCLAVNMFLTYFICNRINMTGIGEILVKGILCVLVSGVVILIFYGRQYRKKTVEKSGREQ